MASPSSSPARPSESKESAIASRVKRGAKQQSGTAASFPRDRTCTKFLSLYARSFIPCSLRRLIALHEDGAHSCAPSGPPPRLKVLFCHRLRTSRASACTTFKSTSRILSLGFLPPRSAPRPAARVTALSPQTNGQPPVPLPLSATHRRELPRPANELSTAGVPLHQLRPIRLLQHPDLPRPRRSAGWTSRLGSRSFS